MKLVAVGVLTCATLALAGCGQSGSAPHPTQQSLMARANQLAAVTSVQEALPYMAPGCKEMAQALSGLLETSAGKVTVQSATVNGLHGTTVIAKADGSKETDQWDYSNTQWFVDCSLDSGNSTSAAPATTTTPPPTSAPAAEIAPSSSEPAAEPASAQQDPPETTASVSLPSCDGFHGSYGQQCVNPDGSTFTSGGQGGGPATPNDTGTPHQGNDIGVCDLSLDVQPGTTTYDDGTTGWSARCQNLWAGTNGRRDLAVPATPDPWIQGQIDWGNCKQSGKSNEQCRELLNH